METNGALYFLPGSHLISPITKRFVRLPNGKGTTFEPLPSSHKNPKEPESGSGTNPTNDDDYVLVNCKPGPFLFFHFIPSCCYIQSFLFLSLLLIGDLVLIHGSVLHKSKRNTSARTRFAYTFHMIDSPPYAEYDNKNWLQPTKDMPFSKILSQ